MAKTKQIEVIDKVIAIVEHDEDDTYINEKKRLYK